MKTKRGDIVLLDFPFSDGAGSKVRPALVVQSDYYNLRLSNTVVALITRNTQRASGDAAQLMIDVSTAEGRQSGLRVNSAVVCHELFTVTDRFVRHRLGALSAPLMLKIDECLKIALGVP